MKINAVKTNFKALSTRAATVGLLDCKKDETERKKIEKIIIEQAKNGRYHIDFQNYGFVVCEAKMAYSRLNESSSQRIVTYKPVTERLYSIEEAAKRANKLEDSKKAYQEKKVLDDRIFNYTI